MKLPPTENAATLAVGYKIDDEHYVKARVNKEGEAHIALTKNITPKFQVLIGAACSLKAPEKLAEAPPSFGFKIVCK